ncbi:hypothetical protein BDR04DRAFT_1086945 [Suillus decipiens]|nr:hypothetical protein BDR04DRAFT_1086945 [Suillus decipiens]
MGALSVSSSMLCWASHSLKLEHFVFADGDNDDHSHPTAAFLARTNAGLQVLTREYAIWSWLAQPI